MRARRLAFKLMRDPRFMESLVRGDASTPDPKATLSKLKSLLTSTGMNKMPSGNAA